MNKPMRIPISNISLTDLEQRYLNECFDSGIVSSSSSFVARFERAFAALVGRQYAVAVCNGTLAIEVALQAMGIGVGDEVICPALTFAAPAAAAKRLGATVVLADIDPLSWTLDPASVADHASYRTKAIIAVDLIGHPADYDALRSLALPILEDAAEAHGARIGTTYCGSFGEASTFSFFGNKPLSTAEGGMILTDDEGLAKQARMISSHGLVPGQGYYHEVVGTNARMTGLSAALGLGQTERFEELVGRRNQVAVWYRQKIDPAFGFEFRPVASWAKESCWLFALSHPERDQIVQRLRGQGIDARAVFIDLPSLPVYQDCVRGEYPHARKVSQQAFFLPTSSVMTERDVDDVVAALEEAMSE